MPPLHFLPQVSEEEEEAEEEEKVVVDGDDDDDQDVSVPLSPIVNAV